MQVETKWEITHVISEGKITESFVYTDTKKLERPRNVYVIEHHDYISISKDHKWQNGE